SCYARPGTHVEWVGKRGGRCSVSQERIQQLTLQHALAGRTVARVKGGDPLLFGRGGEEAAFLRGHGVAVEIVNGIS
ncbi:SAM-dependent methyltransferase, partial [Pseudomonas sp. GW460-13]|uniref:SAM-dependent methyltransferase n=1 Tax=Pseudomonas sp. GW460-13 TaxID=2070590 RepID=UPI000CAAE27B